MKNKKLIIIICMIFSFSLISNSYETTLTISPTSGSIGDSVTNSGTGYTPSPISNPSDCDNLSIGSCGIAANDQTGKVFADTSAHFGGLTPGASISAVGIEIANTGSGTSSYQDCDGDSNLGVCALTSIDMTGSVFAGTSAAHFFGLPAGATITSVGTEIANTGSGTSSYQDCDGDSNLGVCAATTGNLQGNVYADTSNSHFFGLPANGTITSIGLKISSFAAGDEIRVKVYDPATGNLIGQSNAIKIAGTGLQNFTVSATVPASGHIYPAFEVGNATTVLFSKVETSSVVRFTAHAFGTGPNTMTFGNINANGFAYNVNVNNPTPTIRVKIYDPATGNLLGESGTDTISGTGLQNFTVSATVPASGHIYPAFEIASNTTSLFYKVNTNSVTRSVGHIFGNGPTNFGPFTGIDNKALAFNVNVNNPTPTIRVKIYDPATGNLIGQTGADTIFGTGLQNFSLAATVPAGGAVYPAFEVSSNATSLFTKNCGSAVLRYVGHVFGSGPSPMPFTNIGNTCFGYSLTSTVLHPITFTWDGTLLSTIPSPVNTNSLGAFSGVIFYVPTNKIGLHTVRATDDNTLTASQQFNVTKIINFTTPCDIAGSCATKQVTYSFHRTPDFKKLTLTVHAIPLPFNIECNYKNGTFIGPNKWVNFSSINIYNHTDNVPFDQNVYVGCYGSGLLLSFTSPGNSTLIVQGANVFNSTFGVTLGVPIGTFFIAMLASLANQRTGPIYVVVVLAATGIMSAILFFTVPSGAWALELITGFLGLFVGRKIF